MRHVPIGSSLSKYLNVIRNITGAERLDAHNYTKLLICVKQQSIHISWISMAARREILIKFKVFSFVKHVKMLSAKLRIFVQFKPQYVTSEVTKNGIVVVKGTCDKSKYVHARQLHISTDFFTSYLICYVPYKHASFFPNAKLQLILETKAFVVIWLLFKSVLVLVISNQCVKYYRKTSNISRTLVGNKIVDNSDACRRCSNNIFILNLTPGFNGLG